MEDKYDNLDLGPQNDGEPAVIEPVVQEPEPETPAVEQAEPTEAAPEGEEPKDEHKKKSGIQRMREKLQRQEEELRQLRESMQRKEPEPPPASVGKPNATNFETYEDYLEALADWKADQKAQERLKEYKAEQEKTRMETERQNQAREVAKRFEEARAKYADFDDVVDEDLQASQAVLLACQDSPAVGHLAYYFSKHPDELDRLNGLSPLSVAREVGKLEIKLLEEKKPTPKPTTKAPEPIRPVSARVPAAPQQADKYDFLD